MHTSSALDRVVAFALGVDLDVDTAVVMPVVGSTDAPVRDGVVRGLATSTRGSYLVVSAAGATTVSADALDSTRAW